MRGMRYCASAGIFRIERWIVRYEFFAQRQRKFFARRDFDFVVQARVIGQDHVVVRAVGKSPTTVGWARSRMRTMRPSARWRSE